MIRTPRLTVASLRPVFTKAPRDLASDTGTGFRASAHYARSDGMVKAAAGRTPVVRFMLEEAAAVYLAARLTSS